MNRGNSFPSSFSYVQQPGVHAATAATPFLRRDAVGVAALGLLISASYFPATLLGFVWDDVIITTLPAIREWSGIRDLWFAPLSAYSEGAVGEAHYWPLLYSTFWLEHKLWGFAPAGYHVVNILIHFANTALLWRLLLRLAVPGAWFAAAVFAVHPLHVESVTWVIARKDLLSALFYLAAVMTWLRFLEAERRLPYYAALALFAAAMLCKSIAVTLPAALLLLLWWKEGRIAGKDLPPVLPFFAVGLALAGIDLLFYQRANLSFDYSAVERVLIAARSLWFYAGKLLWPADLGLMYPHWDLDRAVAWVYVMAAAAVAAAFWSLRRRIGRGPLACVSFFALTLSPTLGFMDYGYMNASFVADRYQYLAGIGIVVLCAGAAARGAGRLPDAARKAAGAATWNQSAVWKDDLTLFSHSAAANPGSWAAHAYAGWEYLERDRPGEAERHFRRSLELRPGETSVLHGLAEIRRRKGDSTKR